MNTTTKALRRSLDAVFAASAAGGAAVAALRQPVPSATAATDPCAASELARTIGSVATSTGTYLDSHPETNQALTTISQQQAGPQSLGAVKTYFDANPQVAKDMQQLQQPLVNLSTRCKLPISLPQLMGLMQAAQQQGARCPEVCQEHCRPRRPSAFPARRCRLRRHRRRRSRRAADRFPGPRQPPPASTGRRAQRAREAELRFQTFSRLVNRKARKSAPFLLSF